MSVAATRGVCGLDRVCGARFNPRAFWIRQSYLVLTAKLIHGFFSLADYNVLSLDYGQSSDEHTGQTAEAVALQARSGFLWAPAPFKTSACGYSSVHISQMRDFGEKS